MSPSLPLILSFFLSTTFTSVTAFPISKEHKELYKRAASSPHDVGVGFGIAIGALLIVIIIFYLGFRRGKSGSWFWWRARTTEFTSEVKAMSSPTPSFRPTLGRRTTTNLSSNTIAPSSRPSLQRSTTSLSGKTVSSPTPIHSSTFHPLISPIFEKSMHPDTERKFQELGPHMELEQIVYEMGTSSPRRPASAWTATTAKSMTKSEWIRNTSMSASTNADRKSFFTAYRKSGFSISAKEMKSARPSLGERNTRGSFEDWRNDYAPSRRLTHATHRTTGSKSFFCSAAAEIEEQEREYAGLQEQLQIQFPDNFSTDSVDSAKEIDIGDVNNLVHQLNDKHASQDTLVSPISPLEPKSLPGSPPESFVTSPRLSFTSSPGLSFTSSPPGSFAGSPPMPTSPMFAMPVVIRTSPIIDGSEWSYGSDDEDGDVKERESTMHAPKEAYAEKEGEEEMDWTGMEWLKKVYNERRSRHMSGFKTVYIGDS